MKFSKLFVFCLVFLVFFSTTFARNITDLKNYKNFNDQREREGFLVISSLVVATLTLLVSTYAVCKSEKTHIVKLDDGTFVKMTEKEYEERKKEQKWQTIQEKQKNIKTGEIRTITYDVPAGPVKDKFVRKYTVKTSTPIGQNGFQRDNKKNKKEIINKTKEKKIEKK